MNTGSVLQAALSLAEEHGIPVFPCRADKRPYTRDGFKSASTNIEQIVEWFTQHDDALVGVPTGKAFKPMVVDIDPNGAAWYVDNAARLACGRIHKTPRGHHLLYQMPDADVRCSTTKLARGVDVRAEGGYVIWWPAHGHEPTGGLEDITLPPAVALAPERPKANGKAHGAHDRDHADGDSIIEGGRNDALTRLAGKMRRAGATERELIEALTAFNLKRCRPSLPKLTPRVSAPAAGDASSNEKTYT